MEKLKIANLDLKNTKNEIMVILTDDTEVPPTTSDHAQDFKTNI